jgi:Putative bacterial sensory transduction regulator
VRRDVIAAYVEKLLGVLTDAPRVVPDRDGDYPVRFGSALYYVRLVGDGEPDVQVFAVAVDGVEPAPELLAELNDINCRIRFARVFHVAGQVLVETDIVGDAIDPRGFSNACQVVAGVTDKIGPGLAKKYGGRTVFEDGKESGYEPPRTGMYL